VRWLYVGGGRLNGTRRSIAGSCGRAAFAGCSVLHDGLDRLDEDFASARLQPAPARVCRQVEFTPFEDGFKASRSRDLHAAGKTSD